MKILITGATGFLGKKLMSFLPKKGFEVIGTANGKKNGFTPLNIKDRKEVSKVIGGEKPDVVIHCAAVTNVDYAENNKKETFETNVKGTENVALACKAIGAKLIHISTDYVYGGSKNSKYSENDELNATGIYSQSKIEAEKIVEKTLDNSIIARVTLLYGYNDRDDKNTFVNWVVRSLGEGREISAFTDQYSNPTLIDDIAGALATLIEKGRNGIYNVTGLSLIHI